MYFKQRNLFLNSHSDILPDIPPVDADEDWQIPSAQPSKCLKEPIPPGTEIIEISDSDESDFFNTFDDPPSHQSTGPFTITA